MTRVLSALVLLPLVVGTIWFLPDWATIVLAIVVAVLAFREYQAIAAALGIRISGLVGATAVALACFTMSTADVPTVNWHNEVIGSPNHVWIMAIGVVLVAGAISITRAPGPEALADAAAAVFAPMYIGLPLGALAAMRGNLGLTAADSASPLPYNDGRAVVLLLLVVIVVSDSAQYYTGRAFGRRPLSPSISPKKTVEGAIGGVLFGTLVTAIAGRYVFGSPLWILALLGAALSMLGIVGDLFESLLKRSAGVKDSSNLIPGHGGVLDRIDSWLFAAPVYYLFVRFVA